MDKYVLSCANFAFYFINDFKSQSIIKINTHYTPVYKQINLLTYVLANHFSSN